MFTTKRKLVITLLALAALLQLSMWIYNLNEENSMKRTQEVYQALSEINSSITSEEAVPGPEDKAPTEEPASESFQYSEFKYTRNPASEFYRINPDFSGWLKINNTQVDYPVVRGIDNEIYLDRNFYNEPDVLGSIFMDYRNLGMGLDRHTILYGHYTERGLMFGDLEKFLDDQFLMENNRIEFSTPQGMKTYEIFSIHVSPSVGPFLNTTFSDIPYREFMDLLLDASMMDLGRVPDENMNILSLVTCNYAVKDGRLFIHAVEVDG